MESCLLQNKFGRETYNTYHNVQQMSKMLGTRLQIALKVYVYSKYLCPGYKDIPMHRTEK